MEEQTHLPQDNNSRNTQVLTETRESNFWVGTTEEFQTAICFVPNSNSVDNSHIATVYDCSGQIVSETKITFPQNKIGFFEVDAILGDCKITQGVRQAHLKITSEINTDYQIFITGKDKEYNCSEKQKVAREYVAFFPLRISNTTSSNLVFCNNSKFPATIKCRLFTGTRTPEIDFKIPENGTALKKIETEFEEFLDLTAGKITQGYIRILTSSSAELSVSLIEEKQEVFNQKSLEFTVDSESKGEDI